MRFAVRAICVYVPVLTACAAAMAQSAAPAGRLLLTAQGSGVQVYRCAVTAGHAAWVVDHPDATLHADDGSVIGSHFAGPTWRYKDGSEVVGAKVSQSPGKHDGDAPWLVLRAVSHHGKGLFAQVTTITRTDTEGGAAPPVGCDAGAAGRTETVPYRARYSFYAAQ